MMLVMAIVVALFSSLATAGVREDLVHAATGYGDDVALDKMVGRKHYFYHLLVCSVSEVFYHA